jgi:hypothetical protein
MISKIRLVSALFESPFDITDFIVVVLASLPDGVSYVGCLLLVEHTQRSLRERPVNESCHVVAE